MARILGRIEAEPQCWVVLAQTEERRAKTGRVQRRNIAIDQIRHIEPDLVKAKPFTACIPREGAQEGIKLFRGISEAGEVFTEDDDDIRADLFCVCNQLQLVQALGSSAD